MRIECTCRPIADRGGLVPEGRFVYSIPCGSFDFHESEGRLKIIRFDDNHFCKFGRDAFEEPKNYRKAGRAFQRAFRHSQIIEPERERERENYRSDKLGLQIRKFSAIFNVILG